MQVKRFIFSALLAVAALAPLAARAAATPLSPIKLHHTGWTAKDGAPPSIIAIAQTPDRWLWLASTSGIYRFDGVTFERFQPQGEEKFSNDVWGMRVLANGALWVAYRSGGVSVWHKGRLHNYGTADGLPVASVIDFETDWRGRTWAATSLGLRVFDGRRWTAPDDGASARTGQCLLLTDPDQTMWARCEQGTFSLARGADAPAPVAGALGFGRMALAPDRTVWAMGGRAGELTALSGPGKDQPLPSWPRAHDGGGAMLFERDGKHAWIMRTDGVMRIGPGEGGALFGAANGLSGSLPNCVFQDAEGNVWVGTENGLDRFRVPVLSGVALPQVQWDAAAIGAGEKGALWVGGAEVKAPGYEAFAALPAENIAAAVSVVYRDGADVWVGARDGLWHYRDGKRERITLPVNATSMQFHSIARDLEGGLWVAVRSAGTIRLKDGVWQLGGGYQELERRANWMQADTKGRVWFGYMDNRLRMLEGGKVTTWDGDSGLRIGTVLQIVESPRGVWLSGLNGLVHFDGKKFVPIQAQGDEPLLGISGIVDQGDALWLNGAAGIIRIAKRELELAVDDPQHRVSFRKLDYKDGLRGVATNSFPVPSAVAGSDGKLWFATTAGLFWFDTQATPKNALPPPVVIRSADVDGITIPFERNTLAHLPAQSGRVQIGFTALSLTMPERMQFQYQLDGVDRGWQQGGATRTATYTDLAPGSYTFRVKASNNDGVWSEGDTAVHFLIEPAFYQGAWFRVLCALLLALVLWALYKLRVAQVASQVADRFEARLQERERIARDLHDTFLQTIQALLLQMQSAWHRLPPDEPARRDIERSLDMAQAALEEGRDKVQDLRSPCQGELQSEVCKALRAEHPDVDIAVHANGEARPLAPAVQDELHAISLEALRNAVRHAQASCIAYEVCYSREALVVTIRDDGCGLTDDVLQAGHAKGRWGLVGLRERAQRLDAQMSLMSLPGKGTVLTVAVSGKVAYG
jgi:signal transduction histidine kinase/ligand-binding sensor domain-containing protein